MQVTWHASTDPKLAAAQFRVCKLSNGETVGAIAKSAHTGKWTTTQTDTKVHDTESAAIDALVKKARARIWFLKR